VKFVLIFGPQAVGKMTVGQELEKTTDLKLFHNHMTIELVRPFFRYSSDEGKRLVKLFREEIFKAVANSDLPGLIFTFTWPFDNLSAQSYVNEICAIFEERDAEICFVELEAPLDVRIQRNTTPNRLSHKASKREPDAEQKFMDFENKFGRFNSLPGEITREKYIRINTTDHAPEDAAKMIKDEFNL